MQTTTVKNILTAGLVLFIIACNSTDKKVKTPDKTADTAVADIPTTPAENPADVTTVPASKCFSNDGLKYSVVIKLFYSSTTQLTGTVVSKHLESGESEIAKFTGTIVGDQLTTQFRGNPPTVGDASEWTSKPWTIDNKPGKEKIRIVFNAKNYETNKWAETDYEFAATTCQ